MAATNRRWFGSGRKRNQGLRVLTAAADRLDLASRTQARRARALRQGWQLDAWMYRDSIPELRYAVNFLANCSSRMKVYPAAYKIGGEADDPVAIRDSGAPAEIVQIAEQAIKDLGSGKMALSALLRSISTNLSVAAECTLLGQESPETGQQTWTCRSIDEIVVYDDKWMLREIPNDPNGLLGLHQLDPDFTVASRMWSPHPRYRVLADGPLRAMIDDCESLLILRRMIRATGRSRIAGRGMLLIPDELSIVENNDDNRDPEADTFMGDFTRSMMEPIADEGVASSVVPIVVRGPGEHLAAVRLVEFYGKFDAESLAVREELVGIIATGFDLPKEIIEGVADVNHWTAWQVDDNTFRHHVEPHVIEIVDCLTAAYLRPYMQALAHENGIDPLVMGAWADRVLFWYDPTELVTKPDRTADAAAAHLAMVISDKAYRDASGFVDEDAPSLEELEFRQFQHLRNMPPNLLMEFARRMDSSLIVPPITEAGTIPGIKPGAVDVGPPVVPVPAPAAHAPAPEPSTPVPAAPASPPASTEGPPPVTASATTSGASHRLSAKLSALDRDLRVRIQLAANAALLRQLEKAGGRLRSKVAKDETLRSKIAMTRNEHVAHVLGREVVTAAGLTSGDLMGNDWGPLRTQFMGWTKAAQLEALRIAGRITSTDETDPAYIAAEAAMATSRTAAWDVLAGAMTEIAHRSLYDPDPNATVIDLEALVPPGTIRAACSVAGGYGQQDLGLMTTNTGAEVPVLPAGVPVGQIGTGDTVNQMIEGSGFTVISRTWEHGPSIKPFEPHLELDGVVFTAWDDPQLENTGGFPSGQSFFIPGDHVGCMCDWTPEYGPADSSSESDAAPEPDVSEE